VGEVGKWGRLLVVCDVISKTPDLHNQDIENRTGRDAADREAVGIDFHFSGLNYGYY
jgi:hypothetical protein